MKVKLFANLADIAGTREIHVDESGETTVESVLDRVFDDHPGIEEVVLDESGELESHINILVDGRNVRHDDEGLSTTVDRDTEVAIFPPVSGG